MPTLLLALFLNVVLVALFKRWLSRVRHLPEIGRWVLPTLWLKLVVTGLSIMLLSEDAKYFLIWADRITIMLRQAPNLWGHMLFTDEFHWGRWHLVFHGFSNTFFIVKLLSVLNLATMGNALLGGCYLSLFNFIGSWELVRQVRLRWPAATPKAVLVGFLLWPTVVYWTSGLTKESLLVGSGALVLALCIRLAYSLPARRGLLLGALAMAALLHFKMRFFFAVILFGVLTGLGLVRLIQQLGGAYHKLVQVLLIVTVLGAGAWMASEVSPVFRLNKFTSQLQRNYTDLLKSSRNRPHLSYPDLRPTTESVIQHAPLAIVNVLVRPWPWEGRSVLYLIAGLENMALLIVLVLSVAAVVRGKAGNLPFALVVTLLIYCCLVAALLGLTTPNLGTLSRYRVTFLPYLLLLLFQNEYTARFIDRLR